MYVYNTLGTLISQRKWQIQTSTTNLVFHACTAPFHARVHRNCPFFMQTETQLGNHVLCAKSAFVCQSHATRVTRVLKQQQHVV